METTHLDYIIKKCQEKNPKLLELKAACQITTTKEWFSIAGVFENQVQFSDILFALGDNYTIGKMGYMMNFWWSITQPEHGEMYCYDFIRDVFNDRPFMLTYDIKKTLEEQSDETKYWLARLLGYKE